MNKLKKKQRQQQFFLLTFLVRYKDNNIWQVSSFRTSNKKHKLILVERLFSRWLWYEIRVDIQIWMTCEITENTRQHSDVRGSWNLSRQSVLQRSVDFTRSACFVFLNVRHGFDKKLFRCVSLVKKCYCFMRTMRSPTSSNIALYTGSMV